jgi:hypothetical protein
MLWQVFLLYSLITIPKKVDPTKLISSLEENVDYFKQIACLSHPNGPDSCGCSQCGRRVVDGLFSLADIQRLHEIVEKGISQRNISVGGPTIVDINTGESPYRWIQNR